jgi:1,2-phenylacetyl-CoA epoxidase catalytic subunit
MTLTEVIMHLNDSHVWSRQRIAEWLSGSKITAPKIEEKVLVGA